MLRTEGESPSDWSLVYTYFAFTAIPFTFDPGFEDFLAKKSNVMQHPASHESRKLLFVKCLTSSTPQRADTFGYRKSNWLRLNLPPIMPHFGHPRRVGATPGRVMTGDDTIWPTQSAACC